MSTIAPNPMPELAPLLKRLRLSGILDSLETRNREAVANKMPYTDFLALLVADEVARREHKKFNLRIRRAGFRSSKTLELRIPVDSDHPFHCIPITDSIPNRSAVPAPTDH